MTKVAGRSTFRAQFSLKGGSLGNNNFLGTMKK